MRIKVVNTDMGLRPLFDEDYEKKKALKKGEIYEVTIRVKRNIRFHRKFFALINCSWEYLPERQQEGFRGNVELWRKYVISLAGFCEPFYSPKLREWVEVPRSISFDKMEEYEFNELYNKAKEVIFKIIGKFVSEENFEKELINFYI